MASSPAEEIAPPSRVQGSIARSSTLVAAGSALIGAGLILLGRGDSALLAGLLLVAGLPLAAAGGVRLWRLGTALAALMATLRSIDDAVLLPLDPHVSTSSPLAPLAAVLAEIGGGLRRFVFGLQDQADQVRDAALHIGRAADEHNLAATTQAAAVAQVAAAMAELDQIIAQVTANTHAVERAANRVLAVSTTSREVVDAAAGSVDTTRQRVDETLTAIEALRSRAGQIGVISDLILEVADQTHLLSLNAAIEAAGAGPAGQRFSVVAGEVRMLALRTREQGRQVTDLVQEIELAMHATVDAATAGIAQTVRTAELTRTLTSTAEQLTTTARETQELAATIAGAMLQQRTTATEVTHALASIAEAAGGMREQTSAIAAQAGDLTEVARQLRGAALRFGVNPARAHPLRLLITGRETVSSRALAWRGLVDTWNKDNPAQTIGVEFLPPSADYLAELRRQFMAGTAADLVQVINGTEFGRQGYLAPLDDLLSPAVRADFYPTMLNAGLVEGRLYSLPTEALPLIILYNKELFAELGVAPPGTWDALIAAGRRCRTERRWGLVLETAPGDYRAKQWLPFIWQGGGEIPAVPEALRLDTPPMQAAFQLWRDLLVTHRLAPHHRPPYPFYDIANLAEGHCAMQLIGSWGLTMLHEKYPNFPLGLLDLPLPPGGRPATELFGYGLAVNAHSAQREGAAAFVRWALAAADAAGVARVRSLMVEGLPVRQSVVPLVEQEGPVDPAWRHLLDHVYPVARPAPEWDDVVSARLDGALDASAHG